MELNSQQQEAVDTISGAMIISAAPGSGKTRVVTERIKNILSQGYSPRDIVAVTFTNSAAHEMKSRLENDLGIDITRKLTICTFHRLSMDIIRKYGHLIGRDPNFSIYSENDQADIITLIMKDLDIKKPSADNILKNIKNPKHKIILAEYESRLRSVNAFDFNMLIDTALMLLESFEEVRKEMQHKCKFVSIDEFQDANILQYRMMLALSGKWGNVCIVGDTDQNIFSFAGSDVTLMSRFMNDFSDHKLVTIDTTYRCPSNVMSGAAALVKNNSNRIDTNPISIKNRGDMSYDVFDTGYNEAKWIAGKCMLIKNSGGSLSEIAILCRTHAILREISKVLNSAGINTKSCGRSRSVSTTSTAQSFHSYMRILVNGHDYHSLNCILRDSDLKIGWKMLSRIEATSRASGMSILESASHELNQAGESSDWVDDIVKLKGLTFIECITKIRDKLRLFYEKNGLSNREIDLDSIFNLAIEISNRGYSVSIDDYLKEISEISSSHDASSDEDEVKLMTVHTSKGLEWPIVFVPAMELGIFPSGKDHSEEELEEERRLFYVAITRTESALFISRAKTRRIWGKERETEESPFIRESNMEK